MSDIELAMVEDNEKESFAFEDIIIERDRILSESVKMDDYDESRIFESKEWEKFKDKLIAERDRFSRIYETEKGSVYFVLGDGKSFRISCKGGVWKNEFVCDYVFFISQETADGLVSDKNNGDPWLTMNGETYMDREILVSSIDIGLVPFEFGVSGWQKIDVNVDKDKIVIKGDKYGHFSSGVHFGHKITKIIK